ncbi:DNA-binding protein RFX2 isoform X3 [Lingula anatina]|uniref:DNA-binding protein RFX2 isoform X3 n=1 Tax=Lingula anatina TaxID=7574 RepID=A0A1S3JNV7_LINAN|nr:DNA-binding protein RFX2 isoform X3 [Lingula anatina]|eukprot:XP_013412050.1 DNA-binding protein RFX2 isoform X3 [Lingula anatina]
MATQAFTVTNMQALGNNVQQVRMPNSTNNGQQGQQNQQKPPVQTIIQPHAGQQFIVTMTSEGAEQNHNPESLALQGTQAVYPAHVQYVDSTDPALYAASNGQIQTYDYSQANMYTPVSGAYYQTVSGAQLSQVGGLPPGMQGQFITHQGGTYLVQGGAMDGEGHPLTHTTRASPATLQLKDAFSGNAKEAKGVQWLIDNYETAEGVSLPRSTLYSHYMHHCTESKLDPMNPASFGKLIRSVFLGLRTRRLGTRGNSKYHYYGIRIKPTSPLNQFTDDQTMAMRQQPVNQGKRFKSATTGIDGKDIDTSRDQNSQGSDSQQQQHQQFLGDASGAIPNFGDVQEGNVLPEGLTKEHIRSFERLYKEHCEAMLDVVVNLQFSLFEALWKSFWRNPTDLPTAESDIERRLPKERLYSLCRFEPVQKWVRRSDYCFYQALVEVLIPDVLRPIPGSLTQAIRNFAKSLEGWLKSSMQGVPEEMVKAKVGAVTAFAQTLRRYTSLNHLAQAARAVLQNTSQINQMLSDLNRVDFANVQEQASWVCQCDDAVVTQLEQDFKKTLQQQNTLEQWSVWLEGVVNKVLKPHEGTENFPKAARQFLLKWSFYSSMVIRDLTLRSAASFGSFHLIRLLYDEYMFYLVEHKVAAATGESPIAVMGEFIDLGGAITLGTLENLSSKAATTTNTSSPSTLKSLPTITVTPATTGLTTTPAKGLATTPATGLATTPATGGSTSTANTTVTVLTSGTGASGTKTIVVVPVTSAGSGDGHAAKKFKVG